MYEQRALELLDQLRGRAVSRWHVEALIHYGKSAAVFRAHDTHRTAALKIFDPELVARYGELTQLTRIQRELSLRGRQHPNLVEIYDGGRCPSTNHHFLVMQHLAGQPLSAHIDTLQRARIPTVLHQVASAAKFLEDHQLVHRDIKPDNIVVHPQTGDATLLDLGVLRPINAQSTVTDDADVHHFVGTLQYSPPEFLLREEADTLEGWRAVTFYQLGAVLHDLLERRPIFADSRDPYARLVNAVQHASPIFASTDLLDLVHLARNCLVKSPDTRLQLVNWDDFRQREATSSRGLLAKQRIAQVRQRTAASPGTQEYRQHRWAVSLQYRRLAQSIELWLRQWCIAQDDLPPIEVTASVGVGNTICGLDLHFRPAPANRLNHHLLIYIEVRVIDLSINAVELLAAAILSTSPVLPADRRAVSVYRGVATERDLRPVFENTVYPVLELAIRDAARPGRIGVVSPPTQDEER